MIDYSTLEDISLVKKVKDENDSLALTELVSRHTGIYNKIIGNYSYQEHNQYNDLSGEKYYNFYKAIKAYDPDKKMKFSVYLGQTMKFDCMREIFKRKNGRKFEEFEEAIYSEKSIDKSLIFEDRLPEDTNLLISMAYEINARFGEIIETRLSTTNNKPLTFREVSRRTGIHVNTVSSIYRTHIKKLKEKFTNEKICTQHASQ
jgi:RNA polymerase sigma factor (sigma-70 family)